MPAIDARADDRRSSTVVADLDDADGSSGATQSAKKKKSKARALGRARRRDRRGDRGDRAAGRHGRRAAAAGAARRRVPPRNTDASKRELDAMGLKLMDALRTFRVDGELVGRTTGPVVSQFEIEPAPGVKVRQFANLSNDLALAMRAASIRIVAPIPGRGAVGVEVPNPVSEMVVVSRIDRAPRLSERSRRAADRPRQGSRRQAGDRRSGEDAAPADRRRDGLRQVGLREHHHHEPRSTGIRRGRCAF